MEFLVCLIIFCILMIIHENTAPDLIMDTIPTDPTYDMKLVTLTLYFKSIPGLVYKNEYKIQKFFYVYKRLNAHQICDYIFHHDYLYINEVNKIKADILKKYNKTPKLEKINIRVEN